MSSGVSQLLRCEREAIRDWGSGWMNEGADQNAIRRGCSSSRALEWLRSLRNKRRCLATRAAGKGDRAESVDVPFRLSDWKHRGK